MRLLRGCLAVLLAVAAPASVSARRPTLATAAPPVVVPPLETANSQHPDLLPADCGRRLLSPPPDHRPQVVSRLANNTAYPGQFPWHVRLLARGASGIAEHRCSGLIVTQRHVLTAADCVQNTQPGDLKVHVADLRFSQQDEGEQEFSVSEIHVHQPADGAKLADNMALLRLTAPLQFGNYVQPACLPVSGAGHEIALPCEVAGWGRANATDPVPDALRTDAMPLASDGFCSALEVFASRFVRNRTVCSGPNRNGGFFTCRGDAGAGLTCLDKSAGHVLVYGLLTNGQKQGCGRLPGVYAKLSGFVDWLLCHLQYDKDGGTGKRPPLCGPQLQR